MAVHAESSIQLNTIPAYTSLLGGHFYYKSTNATLEHPTPPSANIIQDNRTLSNPSTWGYNTHIAANGIKLRYNEIDLSAWSADNGLQLYYPVKTGGIITGSQLGAQFTANSLDFYKPGGENASASLDLTGLNIVEGSIKLGTAQIEYFHSRDREVDLNKQYYIRTGTGTQDDPYVYEQVSNIPTGTIMDILAHKLVGLVV